MALSHALLSQYIASLWVFVCSSNEGSSRPGKFGGIVDVKGVVGKELRRHNSSPELALCFFLSTMANVIVQDEWKTKIESVGGQLHAKIKKDTNRLIVSGVSDNLNAEMKKTRRMKLPIVREHYLVD
ncbi:hypothetical protein L1887_18326 [Cichorium endivia]|nr:hypothetical protein L1887_18326 [Cichorium endivia]